MTILNEYGQCIEEYNENEFYSDVHYKRATGEMPEMVSSRKVASLISDWYLKQESTNKIKILDVGCSAGHYFRSLKNRLDFPFDWIGVEPYDLFLNKAIKVLKDEVNVTLKKGHVQKIPLMDREVDVSYCCNVLTHIHNINKPISELIRVTSKYLIIRTPVYEHSYRIQLVYNRSWWDYTDVTVEEEFDDNGNPRSFSYFDILSYGYLESVILKYCPTAKIIYAEDNKEELNEINRECEMSKVIPTKFVNGVEVAGCLLLPHKYVLIDLSKK